MGRRRQRDVGLPQRLRRDGPGPRPPGDRQGAPGPLRAGHALRGPHRGRGGRRRGAQAPLGPAALALHELRLRVDDGRHPHRPRAHQARHGDEDLRLLPRTSRHGDGLDRRRVRQHRRPREPRLARLRRRHPAGHRRHDGRRPLQRRARHGAPDRAPRRRGPPARLRDHGGGDDEPGGRAPGARLPRRRARDHPAPRHRADLRRGQDRPDHRRRRRDREVGRHAGHGHARQGPRRRRAHGRDRRHRGGHGGRRGRLRLPGGHLQREPARDGRHAREPARGPHARRLHAPRRRSTTGSSPAARRSSTSTTCRATRSAPAPRAA